MSDTIRVLRVIEYVGPRKLVEHCVSNSFHGTKIIGNGLVIKAATIGAFPEILESENAETVKQTLDLDDEIPF